jgi:hypothetical protein
MPPQRALAAAGRWDLVQAVIAHGGSRQVASDLGWVPAPRWVGRHLTALDALADELRAFCADAGTPVDMPTYAALRAAGRDDLAAAVARHGGGAAVAARLGLTLRRSPRGRWAARAAAVAELRAFIRKREPRAAARKCLPTRTELEVSAHARSFFVACRMLRLPGSQPLPPSLPLPQAAGRFDLVYALARHGRRPLAVTLRVRRERERGAKRCFADARAFAHTLRLRSQAAWRDYCRSGARPSDVPSDPYHAYADAGWAGWPDFLGYVSRKRSKAAAMPPAPPAEEEEETAALRNDVLEGFEGWSLAARGRALHASR